MGFGHHQSNHDHCVNQKPVIDYGNQKLLVTNPMAIEFIFSRHTK
jgi:hypothetical protein